MQEEEEKRMGWSCLREKRERKIDICDNENNEGEMGLKGQVGRG